MGRLTQIVRNFLTLSNYELHHDLAYGLCHDKLPSTLVPEIWRELVHADSEQWAGGARRLFHVEEDLVNARVRRFSGRDMEQYHWGPLSLVRDAQKARRFGTDWIVEYVIPQMEVTFARNGSSEVVRYEEGIVFDKVIWAEYGKDGEVKLTEVD
jgi:hypothetical protein